MEQELLDQDNTGRCIEMAISRLHRVATTKVKAHGADILKASAFVLVPQMDSIDQLRENLPQLQKCVGKNNCQLQSVNQ